MEGQEEKKFRSRFFEIAISLALVVFVCSFSYKLVITPFNFQFDFSNLLSLILALFSIALSALFYFKATETSNIFMIIHISLLEKSQTCWLGLRVVLVSDLGIWMKDIVRCVQQ